MTESQALRAARIRSLKTDEEIVAVSYGDGWYGVMSWDQFCGFGDVRSPFITAIKVFYHGFDINRIQTYTCVA